MTKEDVETGSKHVKRREPSGSGSRIIPLVVVAGTVGGFVALAWYAYHAGSQSVKEDDLLIVEADKTPMKEKPADPGGMQFPNQDKTIFETFAGNAQPAANVERVLPMPEEPMPKDMDASETQTWVNDKLHKPTPSDAQPKPGQAEQLIGDPKPEDKQPAELAITDTPIFNVDTPPAAPAAPVALQQKSADPAKIAAEKAAAAKAASQPAPAQKVAADQAAQMKAAQEKTAKEAAAKKLAEEKAAREAAAKKLAEQNAAAAKAAASKQAGKHNVQLGAYRLRTGGFATAAEAKALCGTMTALGQACIPVQ